MRTRDCMDRGQLSWRCCTGVMLPKNATAVVLVMADKPDQNPLLGPIRDSFLVKRNKKTGLVPRNWLLVVLCIVDLIAESEAGLEDDAIYTYDYTLKGSRAAAIPKLLGKYGLPINLGMSGEGVT